MDPIPRNGLVQELIESAFKSKNSCSSHWFYLTYSSNPPKPTILFNSGRILPFVQNPLFDQRFRVRPTRQLLLQTVCSHVLLELFLVSLEGRRSIGVWQDVAFG